MAFQTIDRTSVPGGGVNEDRAGACGTLAWIIDGATDVVDHPLTGGHSDAAWLADTLDAALRQRSAQQTHDLPRIIDAITKHASGAFSTAATRSPSARWEHPSAAGVLVALDGRLLRYTALGDCALIAAASDGTLHWHGIGTTDAGDVALARAIGEFHRAQPKPSAAAARRHIWPLVREKRAAMNTQEGYGVFSITPPPPRFIVSGSVQLAPGARVLLLTDGFARLVDVFRRYTPPALFAAACAQGLASLLAELRQIEAGDPECVAYPRAKRSDDATALLLAVP